MTRLYDLQAETGEHVNQLIDRNAQWYKER